MSVVKVQSNASGAGIFTVTSPATNTDRTLTLPDESGTLLSSASPLIPQRGVPLFYATQSTPLTLSSNAATKIPINTIAYDTNSCFNTTTNRFTPTVPGFYQINGSATLQGSTGTYLSDLTVSRGGAGGIQGSLFYNPAATYNTMYAVLSGIIYMNGTTDYLELFGRVVGTGTLQVLNGVFNGTFVRAA